ncbi:hypothetical protein [Agathobaculum sp.]|uniref:hypothetical protein n=1 Tax=Agathobaculum sp. TaxID=2048138 RepID=UPI003AEF3265
MSTNDYGTNIPQHEIDALARCCCRTFERSEEGQREYAEWKQAQAAKKEKSE